MDIYLNQKQKEAVDHMDGPLLVFAGAGSGKTRVIISRIINLITKYGVEPSSILAVTFTNKAANEMKERIQKELSRLNIKTQTYPWIGTFHSFGAFVLRRYGERVKLDKNFSIYDEKDQEDLIKEILKEYLLDPKEYRPNAILNAISNAKTEFISEDEYTQFAISHFYEVVSDVYKKYQQKLRENNAVDFDDLLVLPVVLFKENPEILDSYQDKYRYILVDEYQDTNTIQYKLIELLAKKHKNICVVGDDDQSIYSWRGATVKNILSFGNNYPDVKVIKLEQNYRSTKRILDAAFSVISKNKTRSEKRLWTDADQGESIKIYVAEDEQDEANYITRWLLSNEGELANTAILYRTNAQSRVLEEALLQRGIPYELIGGVRFYNRKEIKDVLAYLRFINNPKDFLSLKRIINVPPRKIGPKTISLIEKEIYKNKKSLFDYIENSETVGSGVKLFGEMTREFIDLSKKISVSRLTEKILSQTGYIEWIDDGTPEAQARIENIKELLSVTSKFDELDPEESLSNFLEEVSLVEQAELNKKKTANQDSVKLMTLHSAKGLEFDNVFMVGMEEGLFPHSNSFTDPSKLEEERRLCYVGITRAKKALFLISAERRFVFGRSTSNVISRYIDEIPSELVSLEFWHGGTKSEIANLMNRDLITSNDDLEKVTQMSDEPPVELFIGDNVRHATFGVGAVLEIDFPYVVAHFPGFGDKKLSLDYTKLEKLN